jgi:FAD/FMN-containing dehydrogenase
MAAMLRLYVGQGVHVVPQGGQTGLIGGAVLSPAGDEPLLSLERLDRVRSVDLSMSAWSRKPTAC